MNYIKCVYLKGVTQLKQQPKKKKPTGKNLGLNGIQIHDLCDTTAVLGKLLLRSMVHLNEWSTSEKFSFLKEKKLSP